MSDPGGLEARAKDAFTAQFGGLPSLISRAPGRVELLGNHTDYNGGLVMSAAVDRFTVVAGRPVPVRHARIHSVNFAATETFDIEEIARGKTGDWPNYVKGVIWAIQEAEASPLVSGFELALVGDVPLGAGLSSSASLQASLALFLIGAGLVPNRARGQYEGDDADPTRLVLAHILRRSENEFVGVGSGLLDQFSSLFGRVDHALFLDCHSLEFSRLPLGDPGPAIVVCDSKTSRRLADGMYNRRRAECETVVTYFQALRGREAVSLLRDVSLNELAEHWDRLDHVGRKRARHVLTENERVKDGARLLRAGDLVGFGRLVSASHASSRDEFENSSNALDGLVDAAASAPGFIGGKLSGAGWAGCTVNLVHADRAEAFTETVRTAFSRKQGILPDIHVCHAADGASARLIP